MPKNKPESKNFMIIYGIAGEYNPFHTGHLHHIRQTRLLSPDDGAVVCVMSGVFVQRGDVAVFDAHARAEAAVRSGADLVLELPLPWALSSAEGFALGAAGILNALGIVTHMSFGSEIGDVEPLARAAHALIDPDFERELRLRAQSSTESFARTRQNLLRERIGVGADPLDKPNNILAVEYIKALLRLDSPIIPVTIPRVGSGHDSDDDTISDSEHELEPLSASKLRSMLKSGADISEYVPPEAIAIYRRETSLGRGPVSLGDLETAIISRLRAVPPDVFETLPDASEGLQNRLRRAAYTEPTIETILSAAKSKRYALSRLRRMLLCAALGVTAGISKSAPGFTRLLAANSRGLELLRLSKTESRVPIVVKPSAAERLLSADDFRIFELCRAADDLYALGFASPSERRGGESWRKSPVILP